MAQQTLQTIVAIGGRIDNSFGQIGNALIGMGSQIDMVSQKLLEFGTESTEKFVNYDDLMREVKAVGEFTSAEIKALDQINAQIAKTTIYSNIQAAEAEVIMGQYGMSVKEIQTLLPDVLELSMAGNLSIANSVDYLYSSLMSVGKGFDYAGVFVDMMTKTAAIGATDIDTLGDSLARLGSGAQMFKGGSPEIFAILSAMSQFGEDQRGSQAGTWIRNFMLSLVAPTGDIDAMTDAMYELGYTAEEIDEWAGSRKSGQAAQAVQSLVDSGLQIYDKSGNLLPAIDIIRSLRDTVKGSDEYAGDLTALTQAWAQSGEDVETFATAAEGLPDNALYAMLRTIFNRRGITTALNLIKISDEEWAEITGEVINSEGFAQSMAETMQGGLGGLQREFDAAYTKFQTHVGDILEEPVSGGYTFFKDIVTSLDEMDEGKLEALVAGLTPLALAGPGLIGVGAAFRLIGYALGPAGGIILGSLALVSAVMALEKLREANMADNFGDMDMDMEGLSAYVLTLGEDFKTAYGEVNTFSGALDTAVASYEAASTTFSGKLLTAMLTATKLTDEDKESLKTAGEQMFKAVMDGAAASTATSMAYWKMIFGGEGVAEFDPAYQEAIALLEQGYKDWTVTTEGMQRDFALSLKLYWNNDGIIDEAEFADLMAQIDKANAMIAELENENAEIERRKTLHKMQTASFDDLLTYTGMAADQRDADLAAENERFDTEFYRQQVRWENAIAAGRDVGGQPATQERMNEALAAQQAAHDNQVLSISSGYDDMLMRGWGSALGQSDLADVYQSAADVASQYMQGLISPDAAEAMLRSQYGSNYLAGETGFGSLTSDRAQLGEMLVREVMSLGGREELDRKIAYYDKEGDTESAERLRTLKTMEQIVNGFTEAFIQSGGLFGWYDGTVVPSSDGKGAPQYTGYEGGMNAETARALLEMNDPGGSLANFWNTLDTFSQEGEYGAGEVSAAMNALPEWVKETLGSIAAGLSETYDLNAILKDMGGVERYGSLGGIAALYGLLYGDASENAAQYMLGDEPMTAPVELDTSSVGGAIADMQGTLDANPGVWTIQVRPVGGVDLGIGGLSKNTGLGNNGSNRMQRYGEGGYADEASIFGEAGGEWAIPEEHSNRTAELLNAAREGSGFSWGELMDRTGGLNADASHTPAQLVYSPTIIVKDAKGVKEALDDDKERLEKWFKERQMRDDIEVYT